MSETTPAAGIERAFSWYDHAALWFSLGVGLLVIQTGAYLVPALGTREALAAVVVGSALGAALLAWVAWLGCAGGMTGAELIQCSYGRRFARLPILLNVLQLLGWSTFEFVILRDGTHALLERAWGVDWSPALLTIAWGLIMLALSRASVVKLVIRVVSRWGLIVVVLALVGLSVAFVYQLGSAGLAATWRKAGTGGMNGFQALDLVLAMPVSWFPLVADYARHGRSRGGTWAGTWIGYTLANVWCYGLGVLLVATAGAGIDMVHAMLAIQGGLIVLGLVLLAEIDHTYGALYSAAVSGNALAARLSVRGWCGVLIALAALFALALPIEAMEPFLLILSSVFIPLFGVILGALGTRPALLAAPQRAIGLAPAAVWILGIALYHGLAHWAPQFGSALPTLAVTLVLGWWIARRAVVAPAAAGAV